MIKKTLYFGNPIYLSLRNAQLVLRIPEVDKNKTLTESFKREAERTIPIEDIGVVVLDNRRITITTGAMEALLDNNCAIITCDSTNMPVGLMLPLSGNTTQSERFRNQIEASLPLRKQLWQQTVKAKIENQAFCLQKNTPKSHAPLHVMARDVKSGDEYYNAVLWAVQNGVTSGTAKHISGETTLYDFSPKATCTRGEVVKFLWNAKGKPAADGKNPFTDVNNGNHFYTAVLWATQNSITAGKYL